MANPTDSESHDADTVVAHFTEPGLYSAGYDAARRGEVSELVRLLRAGLSPSATDAYGLGESLLAGACRNGRFRAARFLVAAGAPVNVRDRFARAPLIAAALAGNVKLVRYLIAGGAFVNHPSGEVSPLGAAAASGNEEMVEVLIEAGADPSTRCAGGRTALSVAVETGAVLGDVTRTYGIVSALLAAGADPDPVDDDGWTPLMFAAARDDALTATSLCNAGASPLGARPPRESPRQIAERLGARRVLELFDQTGGITTPPGHELLGRDARE